MLTSRAGAECVSAPTETKSTPVPATPRTLSRVIPPEASRVATGPWAWAAGISRRDRGAELRNAHVVEKQAVGSGVERVRDLPGVAALDLDLALGIGLASASDRGGESAGERDMILLDQDRVVEAHAVVTPAAGGHRRLLERAQARRRLPGVEQLGLGPFELACVARGQRRDPRQVAEQVERRALRREQRAGRAAGEGYVGRHRVAPLALRREPLE